MDTHYILPEDGLWNAWTAARVDSSHDFLVQPKAAIKPPAVAPVPSGPRQLVNNEAASPETFETISTTPKPAQEPSPTVQPCLLSSLLYKLRWANIGWFYHWGTKQYDFTKGKGTIDERLRYVCLEAVRTIDWAEVHGVNDGDWGPNGPDWDTWDQTYGMAQASVRDTYSDTHAIIFKSLMLESSIFIKKKIH